MKCLFPSPLTCKDIYKYVEVSLVTSLFKASHIDYKGIRV